MRFSMSFLLCILSGTVLFTKPALAEFEKQVFLKEGLKMVTATLKEKMRDSGLVGDRQCPNSGMEVIENISEAKGKAMDALASVSSLLQGMQPQTEARRNDQTKCGSCHQTNVISMIASISPVKFTAAPECEGRPTETFSADLESPDDLRNFTEGVLTGKNSEGQRLQAACPDPCAYYVTTAQTALPNGKQNLTLTVQCGPPRSDSIFSAKYEFKAGVAHQWTCSKTP